MADIDLTQPMAMLHTVEIRQLVVGSIQFPNAGRQGHKG